MIEKKDHILIAGLGLEFALIMCIGFFSGYYLDKKFSSMPVYTILGSALAFALGLYIIVKSAKSAVNKENKK